MTITYAQIRAALAQSGAQWMVPLDASGDVPAYARGRIDDSPWIGERPSVVTDKDVDSVTVSAVNSRAFESHYLVSGAVPQEALPSVVDWRNHQGLNGVTSIKNQGSCGSCVGFATIALLESMILIEQGLSADLSEAEFFYCGHGANCGGWWEGWAIGRALHEGALVESTLPYSDTPIECAEYGDRGNRMVKATHEVAFSNNISRKKYLNDVGPMIACMDTYQDFDAYKGGIYSHVTGEQEDGHCVLVIGYDDNQGCWICKNSWGKGWGEGGFFRIAYGQSGIEYWAWRGISSIQLGNRWQLWTWTDKFAGTSATDLLRFNPITLVFSLGVLRNGLLSFSNIGGGADITIGHPIWAGDFNGDGRAEILFYYPDSGSWWLVIYNGFQVFWNYAGNTSGYQTPGSPPSPNYGNLADGRPIWTADFNGDGKLEVLFYYSGDGNWFLGTFNGNQLSWNYAGNTSGANAQDPNYGNLADGRPIWIADFNGDGRAEVLFYYSGDGNWFLGTFNGNQLGWNYVGNTSGANAQDPNFGNLADGRPIWIADFNGDGRAEVLFYYSGDGNWFLGTFNGNQLSWNYAGNTSGANAQDPNYGNLADGRPIWIADFNGDGRAEVLFYYSGDGNWFLGTFNGNQLGWNYVGNTSGANAQDPNFGNLADGRPIWIADFNGDGQTETLFHFPPDGNWWLGQLQASQIHWSLIADTTGLFVFE